MPEFPQWRFRRMQPGEMNIDPIEAEFFSTEALGSMADALVREAIQNSLDARRPGENLSMRISVALADAALDGPEKRDYTNGLAPHLNASRSGLTKPPPADEPLSYIAIEDFGTRGLQGDPALSEDEEIDVENGLRNDFFFFWRNIGRSRKHASELGRWGLGKTVFQAASRINSFFALTRRANDERRLLMGQSVLKIHKLDGQRYYPYGYFGCFAEDFAMPVEDEAWTERFCAHFGLARGHESGLSVVVPYPDPELTAPVLVDSIVRHYFMPIIAGDLSVEVLHDGESVRLDASTLFDYLAESADGGNPNLQRVFRLARWGIELPRRDHVALEPPPEEYAPRWADDFLSPDVLDRLRRRFDAGEPVALTVPVWVKPADDESALSRFDLYLERDEGLNHADDHFVRDGITIAGVRASIPKGIRAIVNVRDRALSALLGDSENPAHTEWQERSPKFKDRYRHGPYTLRYVKNAPREIVRLLTRPAAGRDFRLLQQLFSLEIPTEDDLIHVDKPDDEPGQGDGEDDAAIETVGSDRQIELQKLKGGFRLRGSGNEEKGPRYAAVRVAYDVRRGNALKQYQLPDFELDKPPIRVSTKGAEIHRCEQNFLVFGIGAADFELTVRGFDLHRDIRVKVLAGEELES